jgi:hypothetical protein
MPKSHGALPTSPTKIKRAGKPFFTFSILIIEKGTPTVSSRWSAHPLPAYAESLDHRFVPVYLFTLEIVQKPTPLADKLQQPSAAVVVLLVDLEVLGEIGYPFGENGDLHLWGTCVAVMFFERIDDFLLLFGCQHC